MDDVEDALKQYKKDFITLLALLKDETSEWSVSVKRVRSFLCLSIERLSKIAPAVIYWKENFQIAMSMATVTTKASAVEITNAFNSMTMDSYICRVWMMTEM